MKIVHLTNGVRGGANRALLRHHRELLNNSIDSLIITGQDNTSMPGCRIISVSDAINSCSNDKNNLTERMKMLAESEQIKNCDIVELRLLHNGHNRDLFHISLLKHLAKTKKIVWRLSDMWAFTAFCAYSFDCCKWIQGCTDCPQAKESASKIREIKPPESVEDAYNIKKKLYKEIADKLYIVCPSNWILNLASQSILRDCKKMVNIPVGVEQSLFRPADKNLLRDKYGFHPDSRIVISCIANLNNYRKAADILWNVLRKIADTRSDIRVIILGGKDGEIPSDIAQRIKIKHVFFTEDKKEQAELFALSDVHCFTSRYDNSAQTIAESASCGTPTVCFDAGGNREYVLDGSTGVLIPPYDTEKMANSIIHLCSNDIMLKSFSEKAASTAEKLCGLTQQTEKFLALYKEVTES